MKRYLIERDYALQTIVEAETEEAALTIARAHFDEVGGTEIPYTHINVGGWVSDVEVADIEEITE